MIQQEFEASWPYARDDIESDPIFSISSHAFGRPFKSLRDCGDLWSQRKPSIRRTSIRPSSVSTLVTTSERAGISTSW